MSNKMTKKAQGYPPKYVPVIQDRMSIYNKSNASPFGAIDQFAGMTDQIMQGVQEQKQRSGTAKKDNFYNKYVVPAVNTLGYLTPTPAIVYTIAGHREAKKLERNIKQYQKLHDDHKFWRGKLEEAVQNKDNYLFDLANRQLGLTTRALNGNSSRGRQLSRDVVGLGHLAGNSALNTIGPGPMLELYNMFASKRNRIPSFQDPDTHQSLAGMSPELLQMSRNSVAAKPIANIGNLLFYSWLGGPLAGKAFRAMPYIGRAPNAIQLAAKPGLPYAQAAQKFGYYTLAGQTARSLAHNMSAAQQRKSEYPAYMLPFLSMIPGAPVVNSSIFSAQNGPQQVRIANALAVIDAAMQSAPIPKIPKVYAPYVGSHDVFSSVPGNMLINGVPWLHKLDTVSNYAQLVPFIAPQSWRPYMPYLRGAYDPSNMFMRLASGRNSLDSGQQQRNQLAGQKLFKYADDYMYWPARPVINSALFETLQQNDDLAGSYADYVRAAAAAGEDIKSLPLPSAHWRSGEKVPELEQEQARSVFDTYAYTLDTPNAFAGIELVQNSKQAAAIRSRYMGQLNLYINMLPDEKIADLALQHQIDRINATYTPGYAPDYSRLLSSPVLSNLNMPEDRYQNIMSIYKNKLTQLSQQGYE